MPQKKYDYKGSCDARSQCLTKMKDKLNKDSDLEWGVYVKEQAYAKALAVVFRGTNSPEVHGSGRYAHFHDQNHNFHNIRHKHLLLNRILDIFS